MTFTPTAEQQVALDMFTTGSDLVIEAGAGTGKTSTLKLLSNSTSQSGVYIAFNKAIVTEAKAKMPSTVMARTAHSLAFGETDPRFTARLGGNRMRSDEIAKMLGVKAIDLDLPSGKKRLSPGYLGGMVNRAITVFCQTADLKPGARHMPFIEGIDIPSPDGKRTYYYNNLVATHLEPAMAKAWADITSFGGALPFKHEHYLKMWQLSNPKINADYIMFDEAQDANPVMRAIVDAQDHAQRIYVGDTNQQIYTFTGAVNAMAEVDGERTFLSQSFRFGPEIAASANVILGLLDAELRITGVGAPGVVEPCESPDVILTRTNAEAVRNALRELGRGGKPALVGGANEVVSFAKAADSLKEKNFTSHPELACFNSWMEVQEYVNHDPSGSELSLMVNLIDEFGTDVIIHSLDECVTEAKASLVISTAHKSKGREWDKVRLAGDFPTGIDKNGEPTNVGDEELRLLYVAGTRACLHLDTAGNPLFEA